MRRQDSRRFLHPSVGPGDYESRRANAAGNGLPLLNSFRKLLEAPPGQQHGPETGSPTLTFVRPGPDPVAGGDAAAAFAERAWTDFVDTALDFLAVRAAPCRAGCRAVELIKR